MSRHSLTAIKKYTENDCHGYDIFDNQLLHQISSVIMRSVLSKYLSVCHARFQQIPENGF
jgi:hypothetical protein